MVKLYSALAGYNLHSDLTYAKEYEGIEVDTKGSTGTITGIIAHKIAEEGIFVLRIQLVELA